MLAGWKRGASASLPVAVLGLFLWPGSGLQGNDTGGIIAWSPGIEEAALDMAANHCNRYDKYAIITSVHPWPGDYIGFVCRRPGRWGPVENGAFRAAGTRVITPGLK